MAKHPPLCGECFVEIRATGEIIPVKSLSPEKWDEYRKKMMENVGRVMSDYCYGAGKET